MATRPQKPGSNGRVGKVGPKGAAGIRKGGALAILTAAERLFGLYGLDGVTIRQITLAAGLGNNSAVAYHFGDKKGLLRAICEWRNPVLEHAGIMAWESAAGSQRLGDPAALIGVLLRPFLAVRDDEGKHSHAAFMYQMLRSPLGRAIRISLFDISTSTVSALEQLYAILPNMPPELLRYRLRIAGAAFLDGIGEWDRNGSAPEFPAMTLEEVADELIGLAAAACTRGAGRPTS